MNEGPETFTLVMANPIFWILLFFSS